MRCDSAYCVIIPQRASSLVLILAGETYFWLAKQDIIFSFEGFLLFFGSLAEASGATVVGAGVSFVSSCNRNIAVNEPKFRVSL